MGAAILCAADDPRWLEERRKRVTASDMLCFLGMEPSWWSSSWDEILKHKLAGTDRQMDREGQVSVRHGAVTEALNIRLTGELLGFPTVSHQVMYVNDRWPFLGATTDSLIFPFRGLGPDLDLSTQTGLVAEVYARLQALGEAGVREVMHESKNARYPFKKKNGNRTWIEDGYPDYHVPQMQTGMWIADFDYGVLCARLGGRDLSPWLIERDPEWAERLDEANERAEKALGGLW